MPEKDLDIDCRDGACVWRWDANTFPVDEITIRVRHRNGDVELREVPNTGSVVLPDSEEVVEIVSRGRGGATREPRWRGPGS